jgi:hypothetical protein
MPIDEAVRGGPVKHPERLASLVGLKLCITRNAGNMKIFHFGELQTVNDKVVGQFALHVQCPWRLERSLRILTGSSDYFTRATDNHDDQWEPGDIEGHLQDEILGGLLAADPIRTDSGSEGQLIVSQVSNSLLGDLEVLMSGGFRLVVFPSSSQEEEWRLLRPGFPTEHLVFESGKGEIQL